MTPVKATSSEHLSELIHECMKTHGPHCALNHIDVSDITNMSSLFEGSEFNGDISEWNTSKVHCMESMFFNSRFTGDISRWNVSNVSTMSHMFSNSAFEGDISRWDVSSVTNMSAMFYRAKFAGGLSKWDVSNVEEMESTFQKSAFDGDLSKWDVRRVINMTYVFKNGSFSGNISNWDLASLKYAEEAFTSFQDNALGYLGVLQGDYALSQDFPRAAQFHQLRALAEGLDLDPVGAARFIAREMHQPELVVNLPTSLDFSA